MKWTMRYAAPLAALLMALALVELARPTAASATNEDVEFLQPPSDKGDPDTGGQDRYVTSFLRSWLQIAARYLRMPSPPPTLQVRPPSMSRYTQARLSSLVRR
jgi:hypothetical protein